MASHHQCHHHNSHPTTTTTTCCCYCRCTCFTPSPHPPPPDPLLQSVASHILQPPPQPHLYSPYPNPPYNAYNPHDLHHHHHHHHQTQYYPPQKQQQVRHHHHQQQPQQTQPIVSSLLRRIAALETSLHHQFSTSSYSLRDAAAGTIQTHFRAFLVRRSRILRQLKDLAFVKSTLNTLKTSVSDSTHFDSQALSHRAIDLLLKLDSIQGGDPMIRDGKKSISRDLIRFIEFIDGVSARRNERSSRAVKNMRFGGGGNRSTVLYGGQRIGTADCGDLGGDERELMEKLRAQVEKIRGISRVSEDDDEEDVGLENPSISSNGKFGYSQNRNGGLLERNGGVEAKVKKSVTFAENGNVSRVFRSTNEPVSSGDVNSSDGSGSIDDERELVDNLCREVEEIGGFAKETEDDEEGDIEDRGSPQISNGERNPRRDFRGEGNYEISGQLEGQNGNFVFSAPLPVKMESRADLMKRRKAVKIVN